MTMMKKKKRLQNITAIYEMNKNPNNGKVS